MTTEPTLISKIETDLKTHIFLVMGTLAVTGALVLGSVYGIENIIGKVRAADDAKSTQQLAAVQASQASLETRIEQNEAAEAVRDAAYQATITKLAASLTARDTQAAKDKQTAATLSAADTASAITVRTNAGPGEVAANGNTVVMDLPISRQVNIDLIALTQAQGDLKDTKGQLSATAAQLGDCRADVADLKADKAAAAATLAAQIKKDNDDLQVEKNKGTKKGIKGFLLGVVTVILVVAGHAI
jgi:hypothetical protein